jgi:acyl-CoA synthetase (AMP-forming)/AMP-acid ligase II
LETTARWYADVYGLTQRSAIVSPLPSTYNFSFIAGAFTAAHSGCTYYTVNDVSQMMEFLTSPPDDHDQVVGLVNPVILETVADLKPEFDGRVLLDTGGAPMSRHAVKWYRTNVCDLREGYGLTETCSLTHFDRTGSEETAGTVGRSLPDVETEIRKIDGKPAILLHSPNIGVELNQDGSLKSEWPSYINTGDIGSHDSDGRLRILGRDSDISINGYWPKDTLDSIGPFLGARCAIVRHLPDKTVIVRIWSNLSPDRIREVCARIGDKLSVEISNVRVTTTGGDLLHSQKIPYKENNS